MTPPLIGVARQGPLRAPLVIGGDLCAAYRRVMAIADVVGEVFTFLIPPPAPTDFIHGDIKRTIGEHFSIAVKRYKIYRVVAIAPNCIVIAIALGHRKSNPVFEGENIKAAQGGTEVSALFKYPRDKSCR